MNNNAFNVGVGIGAIFQLLEVLKENDGCSGCVMSCAQAFFISLLIIGCILIGAIFLGR